MDNVSILADEETFLEPSLQAQDVTGHVSIPTNDNLLLEPTLSVQAREFWIQSSPSKPMIFETKF